MLNKLWSDYSFFLIILFVFVFAFVTLSLSYGVFFFIKKFKKQITTNETRFNNVDLKIKDLYSNFINIQEFLATNIASIKQQIAVQDRLFKKQVNINTLKEILQKKVINETNKIGDENFTKYLVFKVDVLMSLFESTYNQGAKNIDFIFFKALFEMTRQSYKDKTHTLNINANNIGRPKRKLEREAFLENIRVLSLEKSANHANKKLKDIFIDYIKLQINNSVKDWYLAMNNDKEVIENKNNEITQMMEKGLLNEALIALDKFIPASIDKLNQKNAIILLRAQLGNLEYSKIINTISNEYYNQTRTQIANSILLLLQQL